MNSRMTLMVGVAGFVPIAYPKRCSATLGAPRRRGPTHSWVHNVSTRIKRKKGHLTATLIAFGRGSGI